MHDAAAAGGAAAGRSAGADARAPLPALLPFPPSELVRLERLQKEKRLRAEGEQAALAAADRAEQERSFARALDSLRLVYQPVVSWRSERVFAHEALLRSAEPGLTDPGALLTLAEKLRRMGELGRAVRDNIARTIARAPRDGAFLVNVDALELLDRTLFSASAPLTRFSERVILEITERAALDEVSAAKAKIGRLRKLGFRIAVDDLGAGYADLSSVVLVEPDLIKMDRSLVHRVERSPMRQKLVRWIAGMCRDMDVLLIAEGVETTAERDHLIGLGCDLFQGHLFARPGAPFPSVAW